MKLSAEEIRSVLTGCLETPVDADGGICLHRFTGAQRETHRFHDTFYVRAFMAAGITMDFYTDARQFILTVDGRRFGRYAGCRVDILIDGVLSQQHPISFGDAESGSMELRDFGPVSVTAALPAGEKRVTVVFPYRHIFRVLSCELSDGACLRPYIHKYSWLAFGDSITQGFTSAADSITYTGCTARLLDAKLWNHGIAGDWFREEKLVPGSYPEVDFVSVAYGVNDHSHCSEAEFSYHMPAFLRKCAAEFPGKPVFVLLPVWLEGGDVPGQIGTLPEVRARIRAEAEKYPDFHVVDCSGFVPHLADFYHNGRLHPNALGMSLYAQNLYKVISEVLK